MSLKFCWIQPWTAELAALELFKKSFTWELFKIFWWLTVWWAIVALWITCSIKFGFTQLQHPVKLTTYISNFIPYTEWHWKRNEMIFFCTQNILCLSFFKRLNRLVTTGTASIYNEYRRFKGTGHHQLCNCYFTIFLFNEPKYFIISHVVRSHTCMKNNEMLVISLY